MARPPARRNCNGIMLTPSFLNAFKHAGRFHAQPSGPFANAERFAISGNESVTASVLRLSAAGFPFAVKYPSILYAFRALSTGIMPVIINTLNRVPFGPFAHLPQKPREVISPSNANPNTAPSIAIKAGDFGIKATGIDTNPDFVFRRSRQTVSTSMRTPAFLLPATTRKGFAAPQVVLKDINDRTANTRAIPRSRSAMPIAFTQHGQPPKYLSGQVNQLTIRVSHVVRSFEASELVRAFSAPQRAEGLFIIPQETA